MCMYCGERSDGMNRVKERSKAVEMKEVSGKDENKERPLQCSIRR